VTLGSDLTKVKVKGAEAKDIRRSLNYGKRRELEFSELTRSKYFELFYELKNLETAWFNHKSTYKKIKFLLSSIKLDNKKISDRHFVVRNKKNKVVAYISLDKFKEPNKQFSFYVDHMFRDPKNYSLAMDFLIVQIIMKLKKEGHRYLDLGFCPFHKVKPKSIIESGLYLSSRIKYLYNSKGVYKYKNKFANYDKPGFLLIDPDYSKIKQCFALGKVTFQ